MNNMFIASEDFEKSFTRKRAKGHKSLEFDPAVEVGTYVNIITEGEDTLKVVPAEADENDDDVYVILCKEFGLVGYTKEHFKNKISVIFLDNGYMLVTLHKGAIVCYLDGKMMMPNIAVDSVPSVVEEFINWVDAEKLLSFSPYFGDKEKFVYDFEFVFEVAGDNMHNMSSFKFKHLEEEDIDLSLGLYAQYIQQKKLKEEVKEVKNLNKLFSQNSQGSGLEFEDDEEEEEDWDDDEY